MRVFFNYKVPSKENDLLREEAKVIRTSQEFQSNFYNEMKAVGNMIDSLEVPGAQIAFETKLISSKLVEMQNSIPTDDVLADMYTNIINNYADMLDNQGRLRELSDAEALIEDYEAELEKCIELKNQAERELRIRS